MANAKTRSKDKPAPAPEPAKKAPPKEHTGRALRETIESFVVAFVWAFLFRTFEAEAFVIPTGSMAPTLMGRHLDVECPSCKYRYRAGARENFSVVEVVCPQCRWPMNVDPDTPEGRANPAFNGDRVIVTKFPYEFGEPQRWDVFVFKYPGEAKTNFIKRLVGLPNETLRIYHGDLYTCPTSDPRSAFEIARKPPDKVRATAQMVYDNDYVVDAMTQAGWPLCWQAWPPAGGDASWTSSDGGRSFEVKPPASGAADDGVAWLRYQHFVPSERDWSAILNGTLRNGPPPRPELITDYYEYNDARVRGGATLPGNLPFGVNWVADLKLDAEFESSGADGAAILELVYGGARFRSEFDLATGKAALSIDGLSEYRPVADSAMRGRGKHRVALANFDHQLFVWVDGKPLEFDAPTSYPALDNEIPTAADLAPAGVGARGASLRVGHLQLARDVYYIADKIGIEPDGGATIFDFRRDSALYRALLGDSFQGDAPRREFLSDPQRWERRAGGESIFDARREVTFELRAEQFFALGDNSPSSLDSRLWRDSPQYVERRLLIGKALFVYWPHYWPWKHSYHFQRGAIDIDIPFTPNFGRMRFVR